MNGLWQAVADGADAIVATQCEMLSAALQYVTDLVQRYRPGGSPQGRQAERAKEAMEGALADTRDVAGRVQQSGTAAFTIVQDRVIAQVTEWLSGPARSAVRAEIVLRLLPPLLTAVDKSGLRSFIGERVRVQLEGVDLAPAAAGI